MICLLAGSKLDAERFARSQSWNDNDWFYGSEENILQHNSFLVLRLSTFFDLPFSYWSRIEQLAISRRR